MRILSIHLQNFGPYTDEQIDLRHVSAATIGGENGAGKSLAFSEAVLWCLFHQCRASNGDEFIRLGQTDMAVTVEFVVNGQTYQAARTRSIRTKKGKSDFQFRVQAGDAWNPVDRGVAALLKANYDIVTASNFITQDDPFDLCKAKPKDRISLLADILDIAKYADYAKAATRKGNLAEGELTALAGQRADYEADVERYRQATQALIQTEADLVRLTQQIDAAQANIDTGIKEQATIEATLDAMPEDDVSGLEAQVSILAVTRDRLEAKVAELKALAARDPNLIAKQTALGELEYSRTQLAEKREQRAAEVAKADDALQSAQTTIATLSARAAAIQRDRARLEAELANIRTRITEYEQVVVNDFERAEMAGKLAEAEQAKTFVEQHLEAMIYQHQSEQEAHKASRERRQTLKDQWTQAVSQLEGAVRQAEQWADQYKAHTATIESELAKAEEQSGILSVVPCDEGLQRQCRFVSAALHGKESIPALRARLAERETDNGQLLVLSGIDTQTPDEGVTRLTMELAGAAADEQDAEKAEDLALREVQSVRADVKRLDQDIATLRQSLPDAAYLTMAQTQLPILHSSEAEKEQTHQDATLALGPVDDQILACDVAGKQENKVGCQKMLKHVEDELTTLDAQRLILQAELADLPKVQHAKEALPVAQQDWEIKTNDYTKAKQDLERAKGQAAKKVELRQALMVTTEALDAGRKTLAAAQSLRTVHTDAKAVAQATITHTCGAETKLAEIEKQCGVLKEKIGQYSVLTEAYKRVPVLMIDNAIPVVETEANLALQKLSAKGMQLRFETQKALKTVDKLVDELSIIVRDQVGERSYETYSGGEKGLANFATRLGLSKLTSTRSGARIETLVIDEAFASLDEHVAPRMRAYLETLPQHFPLVLVITHDTTFKGSLPSQIVVRPGPNGSTVEVAA